MPERLPQRSGRQSKKLAQVARHQALGELVDEESELQQEGEVDGALAAFGLVAVHQAEPAEPLYLWPENVPTWNLFQAMGTQWVDGAKGPAMNYAALEFMMKTWRIARRDWQQVVIEIQAMERATITGWAERKK